MNTYIGNSTFVKQFAKKLIEKYKTHHCIMPLKVEARRFADEVIQFFFPQFSEKIYYSAEEVEAKMILIKRNLKNLLRALDSELVISNEEIAERFIGNLPEIHDRLWEDAEAIHKGDPAAESVEEVILAYPGFLAIAIYRIAHELHVLQVPIFPRVLTEYAHEITGIDIHPGAEIGKSFVIDHGTGIVIGESTVIGNNVKIYQGVTLGALSVEKTMAKTKRHPTIEDNVVIYAQAVILGGNTVIGRDSIIGGNAWLTESVPPNSIVYHKSEVKVRQGCQPLQYIDFSI